MQRRTSPKHNIHHDQRSQQPSRTGRNQLRYGDDTSAYDDDYRLSEPERSRPGEHKKTSNRSVDEDRNYRTGADYGRGQLYAGRNMSRDEKGFANTRPEERHSGQRMSDAGSRQSDRERMDDLNRVRYQGDGRWGTAGESRRGRYTEDASFYEYRESLHNSNARRSARYDMNHEDANYFDHESRNSNLNSGRQGNRHNISDEDYYRQQQRSESRRPHPDDQRRDHDDHRHRPGHSHETRGRNRGR